MEGKENPQEQQERSIPLTAEMVQEALSPTYTHPVVSVFETKMDDLVRVRSELGMETPSGKYGFLADALVEAGSFQLEAKDMIGIWGRLLAKEKLGLEGRPELQFSDMMTCAYMVQGAENPVWKELPRWYNGRSGGEGLPEKFTEDTKVNLVQ